MFDPSGMAAAITAASQRALDTRGGPLVTPLECSSGLSAQSEARIHLKCEHLQRTGSFKFRGAFNKLNLLDAEQRRRGVVAASTGNHGMGVSRAANLLGIEATIFLPEQTSPMKRAAIARMGAQIETVAGDCLAAEQSAREHARASQRTFVSPYNDLEVMAGQGTLALELCQQLACFDAVYVAVGGGGLIGGMGSYLKQVRPEVEIIGCWPEVATSLHTCLLEGRIHDVEEGPTLSDATAGGLESDSVTFAVCQQVIDRHLLVSEAEIATAMERLAREERWIVEGAAGVALAACLRDAPKRPGQDLVVVLCGRNIALEKFLAAVSSVQH